MVLWFNGLTFCLKLFGFATLFGGVSRVLAMHLTVECGVIGITLVVVVAILLLGRLLLLVLAIGHNGSLTVHHFGGFKAFHEVNNFSGTVNEGISVLFLHLDLPTVGSGKEENVNNLI